MDNLLMPAIAAPAAPPQGAPAPQAPPQIAPPQIAQARAHAAAITKALMGLAAKPKGALSKEDLFNAAGDMIAEGAFPTPQAKQQLVAELAKVPDEEGAIRQMVGAHLLRLAQAREAFHQQFGPGE